MPTERIVDLENQRYADVASAEVIQVGPSTEERERAAAQQAALARLRGRVHGLNSRPLHLDTSDLADLLTVLGLAE